MRDVRVGIFNKKSINRQKVGDIFNKKSINRQKVGDFQIRIKVKIY